MLTIYFSIQNCEAIKTVAFTALATNRTYSSNGEVIQCDEVLINIGNAFDASTGKFTGD